LTALFLGLRSRFHFRYNFVEAPAALLLCGVLLPSAIERVAAWLGAPSRPRGARGAWALALVGAAVACAGTWAALSPHGAFELARAPFRALYDLRADHFGLSLPADDYVDFFQREYGGFALYLGASFAALGVALAMLGVGGIVLAAQPRERLFARGLAWSALGVAIAPGVARMYANLPDLVEWELECDPQIDALQMRVTELVDGFQINRTADGQVTVLLGGGWDQLTNNGLRWHALSRGEVRRRYADVDVRGDMIGSLVFPPEPRIRYFAETLATATDPAVLPDVVVLVAPDPERFLYRTRMGPEAAIYRELLAERGGFERVAAERFEHLQADLELYERTSIAPPLGEAAAEAALARHGITDETAGNESRFLVGPDGWSMRDESLRHFVRR